MIARRWFIPKIAGFFVIAAGCALAPGCSSDEADPSASPTLVRYRPVMVARWRSGPAALARQGAFESLPDGPRSFAVDKQGAVHVLDALNHRIGIYQNGRLTRSVLLPNEDFTDFDLAPDGGYVLLDTGERGEAVFLAAKGAVASRVKLVGQGIDDPAAVTGISSETTGVWVELHHATWLRIAANTGAPTAARAKRLGKAVGDSGRMLQVALDPPSRIAVRELAPDGSEKTFSVKTGPNTVGITGLEQDARGRIYIGLWEIGPPARAGGPPVEKHSFAVLTSAGKRLRTDKLPPLGPTQSTTRTVRAGRDGQLYILVTDDKGVSVSRYFR